MDDDLETTAPATTDASPGSSQDGKMIGLLAAVSAPLIAAGLALSTLHGASPSASMSRLDETSLEAHVVEIRDRSGATVLSGEFRSAVDPLGNTEKDAELIDRRGRSVIGEVELEIPASGSTDRRVELEVDIMGLPPREAFTVVVDDRVVGAFTTDDRGSVDLELQEGETRRIAQ